MAERKVDADVAEDVELAEKGPGFERKVGEVVERRRAPVPETADEDLLIERADLGPDSATFIAKGEPVPPELAELPRRPREAKPKHKA